MVMPMKKSWQSKAYNYEWKDIWREQEMYDTIFVKNVLHLESVW